MKIRPRSLVAGLAFVIGLSGATVALFTDRGLHYLPDDTAAFVASFPAPPVRDSAATRRELDDLLEFQRSRTDAQVAAARDDRQKDVARFFEALGLDAAHPPQLPRLRALTDRVEDDVSRYVRAPKQKFRRLRPYEIEPRLEPCIGDVQGDLSYPSGHATYGYAMGYLLAEFVPERRTALLDRAHQYAGQRLVCGVHFASDLEGGRRGALWILDELGKSAAFRADSVAARAELRAALKLPP